ncbi:MAG: hypothetical protein H0U75_08015 [Legionella sp.]|nr:hypothetical protein [Legionella sp.]
MFEEYGFLYADEDDTWEVDEVIDIAEKLGLSISRQVLTGHTHISSLLRAVRVAVAIDLLGPQTGQDNLDFIISYPADKLLYFADVIAIINGVDLFTGDKAQRNYAAIVHNKNIEDLFHCLNAICEVELLSNNFTAQANFETLIKHQELPLLSICLQEAVNSGLLLNNQLDMVNAAGQAYFDIIAHHTCLNSLSILLQVAQQVGYFGNDAQINFYFITGLRARNLIKISDIVFIPGLRYLLGRHNGFHNFDAIIHYENPWRLFEALDSASKEGLLGASAAAQANFNILINHKNLPYLNLAICPHNNAGLFENNFGQKNFEAMVMHPNLPILVDKLIAAEAGPLLRGVSAQKNFEAMVSESKTPKDLPIRSPRFFSSKVQPQNILGTAQAINSLTSKQPVTSLPGATLGD